MDPPDIARDIADLIARFGDVGVTLQGGEEYDWDAGDAYVAFDDVPDTFDYNLGTIVDPFEGDDFKYRFDVYSFAMGNMDGRQLQFFEVRYAYHYPSRNADHHITTLGHILPDRPLPVPHQLQPVPHALSIQSQPQSNRIVPPLGIALVCRV